MDFQVEGSLSKFSVTNFQHCTKHHIHVRRPQCRTKDFITKCGQELSAPRTQTHAQSHSQAHARTAHDTQHPSQSCLPCVSQETGRHTGTPDFRSQPLHKPAETEMGNSLASRTTLQCTTDVKKWQIRCRICAMRYGFETE